MGNSIVDSYLVQTYFSLYQGLRDQLMDELSEADLEHRLGGETETLGMLCREIGEIQHGYVESFRTFRLDLGYRNQDPRLEHDVDALRAWFAELDRGLMTALEGLSEDDIEHRRIARSDFDVDDFSPYPRIQLDIYREALLIFYGKASVYMKALGKDRTQQWRAWIG
jgi:hypothetical protein